MSISKKMHEIYSECDVSMLPTEIQEIIFKQIDDETLLAANCVSKNWNEIIRNNDLLWKPRCKKLGTNMRTKPDEISWYEAFILCLRQKHQMSKASFYQKKEFKLTDILENIFKSDDIHNLAIFRDKRNLKKHTIYYMDYFDNYVSMIVHTRNDAENFCVIYPVNFLDDHPAGNRFIAFKLQHIATCLLFKSWSNIVIGFINGYIRTYNLRDRINFSGQNVQKVLGDLNIKWNESNPYFKDSSIIKESDCLKFTFEKHADSVYNCDIIEHPLYLMAAKAYSSDEVKCWDLESGKFLVKTTAWMEDCVAVKLFYRNNLHFPTNESLANDKKRKVCYLFLVGNDFIQKFLVEFSGERIDSTFSVFLTQISRNSVANAVDYFDINSTILASSNYFIYYCMDDRILKDNGMADDSLLVDDFEANALKEVYWKIISIENSENHEVIIPGGMNVKTFSAGDRFLFCFCELHPLNSISADLRQIYFAVLDVVTKESVTSDLRLLMPLKWIEYILPHKESWMNGYEGWKFASLYDSIPNLLFCEASKSSSSSDKCLKRSNSSLNTTACEESAYERDFFGKPSVPMFVHWNSSSFSITSMGNVLKENKKEI